MKLYLPLTLTAVAAGLIVLATGHTAVASDDPQGTIYIDPSLSQDDAQTLYDVMVNLPADLRDNVVVTTDDGTTIGNRPGLADGWVIEPLDADGSYVDIYGDRVSTPFRPDPTPIPIGTTASTTGSTTSSTTGTTSTTGSTTSTTGTTATTTGTTAGSTDAGTAGGTGSTASTDGTTAGVSTGSTAGTTSSTASTTGTTSSTAGTTAGSTAGSTAGTTAGSTSTTTGGGGGSCDCTGDLANDNYNVNASGSDTGVYRRVGFNTSLAYNQIRTTLSLPSVANTVPGTNQGHFDTLYLYHSMWSNGPYHNNGVEIGLQYQRTQHNWVPFIRRSWLPPGTQFYVNYNQTFQPGTTVDIVGITDASHVTIAIFSNAPGNPAKYTYVTTAQGFTDTGANTYLLRVMGIAQSGGGHLPNPDTNTIFCSAGFSNTRYGKKGDIDAVLNPADTGQVFERSNNGGDPNVITLRNKTGLNETVSMDLVYGTVVP